MNPEARLAAVITALESVGVACLVMGGHAVRFYGLARNTVPASTLHLALVEIVRRRYIAYRKEADRIDKEAIRSRQIEQ